MPGRLLIRTNRIFDILEDRWERLSTQKNVATALVTVFVLGLALVEFRRQGWLPAAFEDQIPTNHFVAILFPFTLLLLTEVVSLVFALVQSIAIAVGKQLEIMSLILIRQSFKELTYFDEPIVWGEMSSEITTRVLYIISDALGALIIFGLLALYTRLQSHRPITADPDEQSSFISAKKLIAVILLISLVIICVEVMWAWSQGNLTHSFFEVFYTLLIFADVLVVLISLRYSNAYAVVFRYFGFAVATVLIRLALTAPRVGDSAHGVTATLFAIALTWIYNLVESRESESPQHG